MKGALVAAIFVVNILVGCEGATEPCEFGYAYHSGKMVNGNTQATSAADCLNECNIAADCTFWDFGGDGSKKTCRLRSNSGNGAEVDESYKAGAKYCRLGCMPDGSAATGADQGVCADGLFCQASGACTGYTKTITDSTETCEGGNAQISMTQTSDEAECKSSCDSNDACLFFFFHDNNGCALYTECTNKRTASVSGSTYKKVTDPCTGATCGRGTCIVERGDQTDGYRCSCNTGYTGDECEYDPCTYATCGNQGECIVDSRDETDGYRCSCNAGYTGDECEYDPCTDQHCSGRGTCSVNATDTTKGYTCICNDGVFRGDNCEIGCNTVADCPFPDSQYCYNGSLICKFRACESDEFRCANRRCIPKMFKDDGQDDCGDNSDEPDEQEAQCIPVKDHDVLNIYSAMSGYDIIIGNPFDTIVDPGVKARIFVHNCEDGYYDFLSYAGEELSCNSDFTMKTTTSMDEYENARTQSNEESASGSVSVSASYMFASAEASASYSKATNSDERDTEKVFEEYQGEIVIAEATCITESVSIASETRPLFTPDFINHLKKLHSAADSNDRSLKENVVRDMIREYGTHFQKTTKLGASIVFERRFESTSQSKESSEDRASCVKEEASASLSVSYGSAGASVEGSTSNSNCGDISSNSVIGTGETMESTKIISRGSRPKSLQTWVDEEFTPVPIKRYLSGMSLLFKDEWLTTSKFYGFDYNLSGTKIKKMFDEIVAKYCSLMLSDLLNDDCSLIGCDDYVCSNGGVCVMDFQKEIATVKCECKADWIGDHCEEVLPTTYDLVGDWRVETTNHGWHCKYVSNTEANCDGNRITLDRLTVTWASTGGKGTITKSANKNYDTIKWDTTSEWMKLG